MPPCSHSRVSAAPAVQPEDDGTSFASGPVVRRSRHGKRVSGRRGRVRGVRPATTGARWCAPRCSWAAPCPRPRTWRRPRWSAATPPGRRCRTPTTATPTSTGCSATACATASAAAGGAERPTERVPDTASPDRTTHVDTADAVHRALDGLSPDQPRRRRPPLLRPAHRAADRRRARASPPGPSRAGCPGRSPSSPPTTTWRTSPKEARHERPRTSLGRPAGRPGTGRRHPARGPQEDPYAAAAADPPAVHRRGAHRRRRRVRGRHRRRPAARATGPTRPAPVTPAATPPPPPSTASCSRSSPATSCSTTTSTRRWRSSGRTAGRRGYGTGARSSTTLAVDGFAPRRPRARIRRTPLGSDSPSRPTRRRPRPR